MSPITLTDSPVLTIVERAVRFHNECVLIPEPLPRSRMPRLVTKSYSLPLWKRRNSDSLIPTETKFVPGSPPPIAEEEDYVGIKLSVPTLTRAFSPPRDEFSSQRLQSCLVRSSSLSQAPESRHDDSPPRRSHLRRASMPTSIRPNLVTIPLRPCCAACEAIVEASTKEGTEWKEKFTKGARRKRYSSSEAPRTLLHNEHHHHGITTSSTFAAVSIIVDEVDQRRKSSDESRMSGIGEVTSGGGDLKITIPQASVSLTIPIQEEDEDQLFPLPPPKRSPNASPIPSPAASSSCLALNGFRDKGTDGTSKKVSFNNEKSNMWSSPPPPSPRIYSHSAPLPSRPAAVPRGLQDTAFLEADRLLSLPAISRASRPSTSESSRRKSNAFARVGSGILRGVNSFGSLSTF